MNTEISVAISNGNGGSLDSKDCPLHVQHAGMDCIIFNQKSLAINRLKSVGII
jgi:hypothetical protein